MDLKTSMLYVELQSGVPLLCGRGQKAPGPNRLVAMVLLC